MTSTEPWRMPGRGLYLASSAAAPGPAVHALRGYYAARSVLRHEFGVTRMPSLALETRGAAPSVATDAIGPGTPLQQ
ncbi:hypothetical protein [Leifsonia sp. T36S-04]|uniref:hypothetical protein n=1 Tax=Leifsonia sp. T36S-04 TaxID=3126622 RepID=UPI0036D252B0